MINIFIYITLTLGGIVPTIYQIINKEINKKILFISIISTIILAIVGYNENNNLLKYSYVSKLDFRGNTSIGIISGEGKLLGGQVFESIKPEIKILCSTQSINSLNSTIEKYPNFPFAYYYRGACKKKMKNEDDWEKDINIAKDIFKITTKIPDHNIDHDTFLNTINEGNYGKTFYKVDFSL